MLLYRTLVLFRVCSWCVWVTQRRLASLTKLNWMKRIAYYIFGIFTLVDCILAHLCNTATPPAFWVSFLLRALHICRQNWSGKTHVFKSNERTEMTWWWNSHSRQRLMACAQEGCDEEQILYIYDLFFFFFNYTINMAQILSISDSNKYQVVAAIFHTHNYCWITNQSFN